MPPIQASVTAPGPDATVQPKSTAPTTLGQDLAAPISQPALDEVKEKGSSNRDTTTPRHHDTVIPRYRDTIFEQVRKAVREFGKEAATHRFTLTEKRAIADLIHTYRQRGIRTSENEITRIAINFVIKDHSENVKESVLEKVIKKLNE